MNSSDKCTVSGSETSQSHWRCLSFDELSNLELYKVLKLREQVFQLEQSCLYPDIDELDVAAAHILLSDSKNALLAYSRILPPGQRYKEASIGRVVVAKSVRQQSLGRALVNFSIVQCTERYPETGIRISAQAQLERFYVSCGFQTVSEPYDEDGIVHLEMLRPFSL